MSFGGFQGVSGGKFSKFSKKRPLWTFVVDFIKILKNLSIWDYFEALNIDFMKKKSENVSNFGGFFREKLGSIEQHKPQIFKNSFLKMQ